MTLVRSLTLFSRTYNRKIEQIPLDTLFSQTYNRKIEQIPLDKVLMRMVRMMMMMKMVRMMRIVRGFGMSMIARMLMMMMKQTPLLKWHDANLIATSFTTSFQHDYLILWWCIRDNIDDEDGTLRCYHGGRGDFIGEGVRRDLCVHDDNLWLWSWLYQVVESVDDLGDAKDNSHCC